MQLTRIGPFALEEPLDGTGKSNVVRGVHVELKASMAVKLLPRSIVNRPMRGNTFSDDVKKLQGLVHPSIVRTHGGAVEGGQPYLALELVDGESLREQLDRRGKLPWDMTVDIADAICEALQHAHKGGFVHQRVTPMRVILPTAGGVKLCGFDCVWSDRDEVLGLRAGMSVAHYLAPEAFRGKRSASLPPCDLFSLGVIIYECLTGELPWPADSPAELVQARRDSPAPRVSAKVLDCPVWLDVLVTKLLAIKRSERLSTAEETHRAIVNAKRKVAAGVGAAQHAWAGKRGTLSVDDDRSEIVRIKRQETKTRDDSPFYERAWFLAGCLAAVIGAGVWALQPDSEDQLFAKAKPLMESDNSYDWKRAEEQYLVSLRERFPDSQYAPQIEEFTNRVEMHRAETRVKNNQRLGRPAESKAERHFGEGLRYEGFGDRLTAWKKYESLVNLFENSDDPTDQAYVKLAKRQISRIKSDQSTAADQATFVRQHLERAESSVESGNLLEARRILDSVISLYDGNQEVRPLVEQARTQMRNLDAGNNK